MKRKAIIFLIVIAVILVCVLSALVIKFGKKDVLENDLNIPSFDTEDNVENSSDLEDEKVVSENKVSEMLEEEKNTSNKENVEIKRYDNTPTTPIEITKVENERENENNNYEVTKQENKAVETIPQVQPKVEENKNEQEKKNIAPQCTDKHFIGAGNTNLWFNSEQSAINYYDSIQKKWGEQWEKNEIDTETYDKNCPYGYEVWSCPYCNMWTINFYYR